MTMPLTPTASAATTPSLTALPSVGSSASVAEVLWAQRRVESYGTLTRIEVPIAGDPRALPTCAALSAELERRWVTRRALAPAATPTSVVVSLVQDLGSSRLVLLVGATRLPLEHTPLSVAMARDLRAAIRRCSHGLGRMTPQMRLIDQRR